MENRLKTFNALEFQQKLIDWFLENQRDLPWRKSKDPYRIWVSEIMLQQTRVDTVIPYYEAFIRNFPTAEALASSTEDDVLKAWEGLGYYSRVINLHQAVKEVVGAYDGHVPNTREQISTLKGIGPYTAGAILSIAFDQPEHAVDGNVMRVLSRIFYIKDDITKYATRKLFEDIVSHIISKEDPSSFNQGLMELGALICTPRSPGCLLCPVQTNCLAFREGVQDTLPVKSKKKKPKQKNMAAVIIKNEDGKAFIEKRPDEGLLAKLWQFPNMELVNEQDPIIQLESFLRNHFSIHAKVSSQPIQHVEHVFTHLKWNITVYEANLMKPNDKTMKGQWIRKDEVEQFAFPVSHQKIIQHSFK